MLASRWPTRQAGQVCLVGSAPNHEEVGHSNTPGRYIPDSRENVLSSQIFKNVLSGQGGDQQAFHQITVIIFAVNGVNCFLQGLALWGLTLSGLTLQSFRDTV